MDPPCFQSNLDPSIPIVSQLTKMQMFQKYIVEAFYEKGLEIRRPVKLVIHYQWGSYDTTYIDFQSVLYINKNTCDTKMGH